MRPANLSLELLQTFVAVVATGGDAMEASRRLGINQPSMSKRLRPLQHAGRRLRKPWLVRVGKKWELTEEGQKILPAVEDVIRRMERLRDAVAAARSPQLLVGCGQEAVAGFVLDAVRLFRRRLPEARFRILTQRGTERVEGVANGFLDLAVVTHSPEQVQAEARRPLHVEELFEDPLVLVCAEQAPWAAAFRKLPDSVPARALTSFPLVLPEPDASLRKELDRRLRSADVEGDLQVVLEVGGWRALLAYVRAGIGVGLVPQSLLVPRRAGLLVKSPAAALAPANTVRLICRYDPDHPDQLDLPRAGEVFCKALRKAVARFLRRAGK
jgi:DNA-binding transcriptional LysR family regulator